MNSAADIEHPKTNGMLRPLISDCHFGWIMGKSAPSFPIIMGLREGNVRPPKLRVTLSVADWPPAARAGWWAAWPRTLPADERKMEIKWKSSTSPLFSLRENRGSSCTGTRKLLHERDTLSQKNGMNFNSLSWLLYTCVFFFWARHFHKKNRI